MNSREKMCAQYLNWSHGKVLQHDSLINLQIMVDILVVQQNNIINMN